MISSEASQARKYTDIQDEIMSSLNNEPSFIGTQECETINFETTAVDELNSSRIDTAKVLKEELADLIEPNPKIFWLDLILSSTVAWGCIAFSLYTTLFSIEHFFLLAVSVLAMYRATMFVHELSHMGKNKLKHFGLAWNFLVGFPLLYPSFTYVGIHKFHHSTNAYGTDKDPQYIPFLGNRLVIIQFLLQSLLYPLLTVFRFLIISPFGLIFPKLHLLLERHTSSFVYNIRFTRQFTKAQSNGVKLTEAAMLLYWACLLYFVCLASKLLDFIILWYMVSTTLIFLNSVRALIEHKYQYGGDNKVSRSLQVADSLNVTTGFWNLILSPANVGYHATHHLFPSIPYHNLPLAHKRLLNSLETTCGYDSLTAEGSLKALCNLWNGII